MWIEPVFREDQGSFLKTLWVPTLGPKHPPTLARIGRLLVDPPSPCAACPLYGQPLIGVHIHILAFVAGKQRIRTINVGPENIKRKLFLNHDEASKVIFCLLILIYLSVCRHFNFFLLIFWAFYKCSRDRFWKPSSGQFRHRRTNQICHTYWPQWKGVSAAVPPLAHAHC